MALRIEDYAMIADGHTSALVGNDGSIYLPGATTSTDLPLVDALFSAPYSGPLASPLGGGPTAGSGFFSTR